MKNEKLKKYEHAMVAVDVVILTVSDGELKVLLIGMKKAPFEGSFAVLGGLVHGDESLDVAAARHLYEKTSMKNVYLEQFASFGEPKRDPFGRVVSVAYFALLPNDKPALKTPGEYSVVGWFPVRKLPKLAYDHKEMIATALARLRGKFEYTNIAYSLLPKEFTLTELQEVHEIILGRKIDKRNFRKKFLAFGVLQKTAKLRTGGANRPAELYRFAPRK
jgi:8-oxo-dGTP diphosphatase